MIGPTNYLINKAAAKHIGYSDPLGKSPTQWGRPGTSIGVLKEFHCGNFHKLSRSSAPCRRFSPYDKLLALKSH